jgi:hypothetical protein
LTDAPQGAGLVALADRIELWPIDRLRPYERNPRTHSDVQVDQIAASMVEFGWTNPVLVDEQGGILAGHGRLLAARKLSLAEVPVIRFEHLSEAYEIALPYGLTVTVRPLTTAGMAAAQATARRAVEAIERQVRERTEAGLALDGLPDLSVDAERDGFLLALRRWSPNEQFDVIQQLPKTQMSVASVPADQLSCLNGSEAKWKLNTLKQHG